MNSIKRISDKLLPIFLLTYCLTFAVGAIHAQSEKGLIHFQHPEPQSEYPPGLRPSPHYQVFAKKASDGSEWGDQHLTATYEAWPDYLDPETIPSPYRNTSVHFAQVDANERIRFRVEMLKEKIKTLNIVPSRYIEVQESLSESKKWLEFEVDPSDLTKHILVEINESKNSPVLNHGLMIFLNPISSKPVGNVLELPAGVITPKSDFMDEHRRIYIDENSPYDAIYIPSNTIVDGRLDIRKKGFKVAGRGILVGSSWKYAKQENWHQHYPITPDHKIVKGLCSGAGDTSFEGIMTVHPYHFNFTNATHFTNLKAFGWRYSSDGFHGKYIRGCFAKVNDDHQYTNEGLVERGSYWGMNNGGIFQLGWGRAAIAPGGNCRVRACNVLRTEWPLDGGARQNNGVFSGVIMSKGVMQNNLFEDIRIDGQCFRFIGYKLGEGVELKNFTFRDIWFAKPLGIPTGYKKAENPFDGYLISGQGINGFVFDNIEIDGKKATSLEDLGKIYTENLEEVTFK